MTSENKSERLINLLMLLLSTRRPLTAAEIREKIPGYGQQNDESFHRMFERDKVELRDLGLPLEQDDSIAHGSGYRIPARDALLEDPGLTPDEQAAISLAAQAWETGPGASDATLALLKISAVAGDAGPGPSGWLLPRVAVDRSVHALLDAVLRRKRARFAYRSGGGGEARIRAVEPLGLVHRGGWYLVARDAEADGAIRHFKLSRVAGDVEVDPGKEPDFEPAQGPLQGPRAPWEGEGLQAMLAFAPDAAWSVERRPGVRRVAEWPDGWVEMAMPIADVDSFASWVAGFGADSIALAPDELRAAVVAHLRPLAGA